MPIGPDVRLAPVVPYVVKKLLAAPDTSSDSDLVLGVELEIENLSPNIETRQAMCVPGMQYHEDGSLRNNGGEFVTLPMKMRELEYILNQFFMKNKLNADNYSERCSVHVHANVGDLTWEQLKTLVLVYLVFERLLFGFIGNDRDKNIFCVPLYDTTYTSKLLSSKDLRGHKSKFGKWEKYTALNFLPITRQGSIEFRHMAGTNDVAYIMLWCNLIGKMFRFARRVEWDNALKFFNNLNTSSAYRDALTMVFGEYSYALERIPHYTVLLEDGVLAMKYAIGVEMAKKKKAAIKPEGVVEDPLNVPNQVRRPWQEGDPDFRGRTRFPVEQLFIVELPLNERGDFPVEVRMSPTRIVGVNEQVYTLWQVYDQAGNLVRGPNGDGRYPAGLVARAVLHHTPIEEYMDQLEAQEPFEVRF